MQKTLVRRFAIGFFVLYTLAVTWPVASLFRSAEPLILGLPLSLAWPIGWILLGWFTLLALHFFEQKDEAE